MCGTNKEIQLGNISVIERNAYGMQKSARPSPPLSAVSSKTATARTGEWQLRSSYTPISLPPCVTSSKKANVQTKQIIIVHINLVTLIVTLMKIRNSITKRNTSVKQRNPYWILSSKLLSPSLLSAGNHNEDRWNTTLNPHQRHHHHQPYPTSRCSGHLSESYALLRCSTSWSSFWYCGCSFNSSSSTPR